MQRKAFTENMYKDISLIWRNMVLNFIMSSLKDDKDLLLLRIADKCNVKDRKFKKIYCYKIELWYSERIKKR